jgi:hypothetical protein
MSSLLTCLNVAPFAFDASSGPTWVNQCHK